MNEQQPQTERPAFYATEQVFRTGDGSETIEFGRFGAKSLAYVVSIDSWDAPEVSMRISRDAAIGLRDWLTAAIEDAR